MEESTAARAVMIGVSVFLSVSTISLVLMYYNTAKIAANSVGTGIDVAGNYTAQVLANVQTGNIVDTTEMINIINYYYGSKDADISVDVKNLYVIGEKNENGQITKEVMFYQEAIGNDSTIYSENGRIIKGNTEKNNVSPESVGDLQHVNNNHLKYNVLTNIVVPFQKFKVNVGKDAVGRNYIKFRALNLGEYDGSALERVETNADENTNVTNEDDESDDDSIDSNEDNVESDAEEEE